MAIFYSSSQNIEHVQQLYLILVFKIDIIKFLHSEFYIFDKFYRCIICINVVFCCKLREKFNNTCNNITFLYLQKQFFAIKNTLTINATITFSEVKFFYRKYKASRLLDAYLFKINNRRKFELHILCYSLLILICKYSFINS